MRRAPALDASPAAPSLDHKSGLQAAIAELAGLLEERPDDLTLRILIGELHARAGDSTKAIDHLSAAADALYAAEDRRKAAALYSTVLAIDPQAEDAILSLAAIAVDEGRTADACAHFREVADRRVTSGNRRGANELRIRIADLMPHDADAQIAAASARQESGDTDGALRGFKGAGLALVKHGQFERAKPALEAAMALAPDDDEIRDGMFEMAMVTGDLTIARANAVRPEHALSLVERLEAEGHREDILAVLQGVVGRHPENLRLRAAIARHHIVEGDGSTAAGYLTAEMAEGNAGALFAMAEVFLRAGRAEQGRSLIELLAGRSPEFADAIARLGCEMARTETDRAWPIVEVALNAWTSAGEWLKALPALKEFLTHAKDSVPALLRLVEVAVESEADRTAAWAQSQLVDAYLKHGYGIDALAVAQDLADREPSNPLHKERVRRATALVEASSRAEAV